jgi:hypothetical protein
MFCRPSRTDECSFVALYEPNPEPSDPTTNWYAESVMVSGLDDEDATPLSELKIERRGKQLHPE